MTACQAQPQMIDINPSLLRIVIIMFLLVDYSEFTNIEYYKKTRDHYNGERNGEQEKSDVHMKHNFQRIARSAEARIKREPKIWDQWGKWSSCSVTCGAGKLTRWRHCIGGSCLFGEKKAQLKTCTFPAC